MSRRKETTDLSRAFGQAVRALRTQAGFTQEGFAHVCGVDRGYMGVIERGGTNPTVATIWKIASSLNKRPREVIEAVEVRLKMLAPDSPATRLAEHRRKASPATKRGAGKKRK